MISSQQMLELFFDGVILLEALEVDPADEESEHDPVFVEHSSCNATVAGLEKAGGDQVQPLRVVGVLAQF